MTGQNIPVNIILLLSGYAFILFIIMRVLKKQLLPVIKNTDIYKKADFYFTPVRNIVWILFFVYAFYKISLFGILIPGLIAILGSLLTWTYIKDIVNGIFFKFHYGNLTGQRLLSDYAAGKIIHMGEINLVIENETGEVIYIPYHRLTKEMIKIPAFSKHVEAVNLTYEISSDLSIEEAHKKLMAGILNIPWIISDMRISVEPVVTEEEKIVFRILAFTFDKKYIPRIKKQISSLKV